MAVKPDKYTWEAGQIEVLPPSKHLPQTRAAGEHASRIPGESDAARAVLMAVGKLLGDRA